MQAVHDAGYPFSSLSEQGNQVLRTMVWQDMKQHPYAVVQRTLQQLLNTLAAPFNWGEPQLNKSSALNVDVLRQELKSRLGVGINVAKLRTFRSENLYASAREDAHAKLALAYQIAAVGCGSMILILGLLGMAFALLRAKETRSSLLLWLLALTALYKCSQDILLAYQVNYLNNVYPMFLPFVAISLTSIFGRFRRRPAIVSATSG
jgi:hypothetical protein